MLELLLPPAVGCAEERWGFDALAERPVGPGIAHAQEAQLVAGASARRRREFLLGRACAHRALDAVGAPDGPIGRGPHGEPCWPDGFTGSITHCAGYCAAAAAPRAQVAALGIDAEPNEPISERLLCRIAEAREREHVLALLAGGASMPCAVRFDRLLFCVKEALYKALFARSGTSLSFAGSQVRFVVEDGGRCGGFEARLAAWPEPPPRDPLSLAGRWCLQSGVLAAALVLVDACDMKANLRNPAQRAIAARTCGA